MATIYFTYDQEDMCVCKEITHERALELIKEYELPKAEFEDYRRHYDSPHMTISVYLD